MDCLVVIPAFNAELTIIESLNSLMNQDFTNFDVLVINDGSSDATHDIVEEYIIAIGSDRIKLYDNPKNIGLINTLNYSLEYAIKNKYKYYFRMDADDCINKNKIKEQYYYLENHSEVTVCSTFLRFKGKRRGFFSTPTSHEEVNWAFLGMVCPVVHASSAFRVSFFNKHNLSYNINFQHAEDSKMWFDIISLGGLISNIPKYYYDYVVNDTSVSNVYSDVQRCNANLIILQYYEQLLGRNLLDNERTWALHHFSNEDNVTDILSFFSEVLSLAPKEILRSSLLTKLQIKLISKFPLSFFNILNISKSSYVFQLLSMIKFIFRFYFLRIRNFS